MSMQSALAAGRKMRNGLSVQIVSVVFGVMLIASKEVTMVSFVHFFI